MLEKGSWSQSSRAHLSTRREDRLLQAPSRAQPDTAHRTCRKLSARAVLSARAPSAPPASCS